MPLVAAFRKGLSESGFTEHQNVSIEYRYANGQYERLSALAGELARRPVDVIFAGAPPAALAAKVATTTIPIIFVVGLDPVAAGLVLSFNQPGGNATGITMVTGPLAQKRLEILRELLPKAANAAMLVNPNTPDAVPELRDVQAAAQVNGFKIVTVNATTAAELDQLLKASLTIDLTHCSLDPILFLLRAANNLQRSLRKRKFLQFIPFVNLRTRAV